MLRGMNLGATARRTGAYDVVEPLYSGLQRRRWESSGRPIPAPSSVKREVLREYGRRFGLRVLVETGTYKADTVRALRNDFDEIHSIEIDDALYQQAVARCRKQMNARLYLGDSAEVVSQIVATLSGPALFWLDAHYSGEGTGGEGGQPIVEEVREAIEANVGHVLLVDDVREFGSADEYPQLDALKVFAAKHGYDFEVQDDIARLVPTDGGSPA